MSRKSTSSIDLSSFMVLLLLPLAHFRDRYAYTFFGGQIRTIVTPHTYLSKHGLAINHDCFRHISNYHGWLFKKGRNQWSLSLTWDKSIALVKTHYLNLHYSRYTWFYLKTCNEIATHVLRGYYIRIMANVLAPWIFR